MMLSGVGQIILLLGLLLTVAGLVFMVAPSLHMPGDLSFSLGNTKIYFPIVTCIILSVIGTILLNLISGLMHR